MIQRLRGPADVFFTGLSAVPTTHVDKDEPFSPSTRSGSLLREIEGELKSERIYYTNLVKCLPLRDKKIRYPLRSEMEFCFKNYKTELAQLIPKKVVLFGKQVSDFVAEKLKLQFVPSGADFDFPIARLGTVEFLAAYHPSYVLVYKRRKLETFRRRITAFLNG